VLAVLDARHDFPLRGPITDEFVGDHNARWPCLSFQQLPERPFGGAPVAPASHEDVENRTAPVYRAPQPPRRGAICRWPAAGTGGSGARMSGRTSAPLPDGLMANHDAASGRQFLDHARPEREAEIQPYDMVDDLGGEAVSDIRRTGGCCRVRLSNLVRPGKLASPSWRWPGNCG
jgi:hypothetical protein